ncbi:MAG TPA: T9SS type A sorting domain-containing protein [Bacteroidia bacterium]|nr:T9SS type A sorting domain-containing protein [Bacteroidia bacterium]
MKSLSLGLLLTLFSGFVSAQWIQSISVQPSSPTTNDSIFVIASVSFPSGGCSDKSQFTGVVGNQLYGNALHCLGQLAFICSTSDTFAFPPAPAGSYTFHFQLNAGQGPSPCTPGIVAGPTDSIVFVVTPTTGLQLPPGHIEFSVLPNPASAFIDLQFQMPPQQGTKIEIIDMNGRLFTTSFVSQVNTRIPVEKFPAGNYLVKITDTKGFTGETRFTIIR